jgi:hypothetical protein
VTASGHAAAVAYIRLERDVSHCITAVCKSFCSACMCRCCKPDFCQESFDSDWLLMVREAAGHGALPYDNAFGWLAPTGCRLGAGRPPICYEFFCDAIQDHFTFLDTRQVFAEIGRLVNFAGQRALGGRHLVTLTEKEISEKLDFGRLLKRITSAADMLHRLQGALPARGQRSSG